MDFSVVVGGKKCIYCSISYLNSNSWIFLSENWPWKPFPQRKTWVQVSGYCNSPVLLRIIQHFFQHRICSLPLLQYQWLCRSRDGKISHHTVERYSTILGNCTGSNSRTQSYMWEPAPTWCLTPAVKVLHIWGHTDWEVIFLKMREVLTSQCARSTEQRDFMNHNFLCFHFFLSPFIEWKYQACRSFIYVMSRFTSF